VALTSVALAAWAGTVDGVQPVLWSAERPLTWADFQGIPDPESPSQSAATSISLTYNIPRIEYGRSGGGHCAWPYAAAVQVQCTMNPLKSWVRPAERTAALLNHEQRHFDIAQVYSRKIRSAIVAARGEGSSQAAAHNALGSQLTLIWQQHIDRLQAVNDQYDAETSHGTNAGAQAQWDQRIDGWLANPASAP
jgi:hypothetical protein